MKKGISIWSFAGGTLEENMKLAKAAGFDGIELALDETGEVSLESTKEDILKIKETAEKIGIELYSVASGLYWTYNYTSENEDNRNKAKKITKKQLEIASWLGCDTILVVPGWFSWARTIEYGSKVGATPNGRKAFSPISHGANPNPHFRNDGAPTAQSNGIASVQCGYGNTAPLQIEFDPHVEVDENGIDTVLALIEGHFAQGGTLININVLDTEKLMEAHKNPDLYPDLVVRVTGFTAYFASLTPEFRQLVVDRFLK